MKFKHRSLSSRLVWLFIGMSVLFVVLVGGAMGLAFKSGFEENLRPHLVRYIEYIQEDLGSPPDRKRAVELTNRLPVEIYILAQGEVWSSTGHRPNFEDGHRHEFTQNGRTYQAGHYDDKEYLFSTHENYTLGFSIPKTRGPLHWRMLVPIVLLLLILMLLYHSTKKLLSPIKTLKQGVENLGKGDLDQRVAVKRKDELGDLANSFNSMADDIQQMLESKRQLLLAISHELRSPLTRAKVLTEMLENKKRREEFNRELNQMQSLIEELLETERLSSRHSILNLEDTNLEQLIHNLLNEDFADEKVELRLADKKTVCRLDQVRIKLLLKNLVGNSLKHNDESASVPVLAVETGNGKIHLMVKDYGEGIEEKHLPFLTEPFYRVDPARKHETGSYGLGLYLCRMISEAHGGSLTITSKKGQGTEVHVSIPCLGASAKNL